MQREIYGLHSISLRSVKHWNVFPQDNVPTRNQPNLRIILLKMTIVMGITWILGFALDFHPTPYLEYPFTIINSCQGNHPVCRPFCGMVSRANVGVFVDRAMHRFTGTLQRFPAAYRAVFDWVSQNQTKVITLANHDGYINYTQPIIPRFALTKD